MTLREQKKQQCRADILAAAERMIGRKGYQHAKMRDIASAAEVSYQTLYNYFPNKAVLLQALLQRDQPADEPAELALRRQSATLTETIYALIKRRFDAITHGDRDLWREVVLESLRQSPNVELRDTDPNRPLERTRETLRSAQLEHRLDAYVDTDGLAETILEVADMAFLRYVLQPTRSKVELLGTLKRQIDLVVKPYEAVAN